MGAPTVMSAVTDVLRAETGNVSSLAVLETHETIEARVLRYVADSTTVARS